MQELLLEPLVRPEQGSNGSGPGARPQGASQASAAAPWVPAAPSVAEWNATAERPEAAEPSSTGGSSGGNRHGISPPAQRLWPAAEPGGQAAPSQSPEELQQQFDGMLRLDFEASQRPPLTATGEAATCKEWNAFSEADAPCMRVFPCPADTQRQALVRGLAVVQCESASGGLRRGVVWYDAKLMLHFASVTTHS